MKVLMVIRSTAYSIKGGDTIQMEKTAQALRQLGVKVDIRLVNDLDGARNNFDLAHIFNIQTADESRQAAEWVMKTDKPWVLSSIYWEPLSGWYGATAPVDTIWENLHALLGREIGFGLYSAWQKMKNPRSSTWQAQRWLLRQAGAVLPNAWTEWEILCKDFRLPGHMRDKVTVVPNGVDLAVFGNTPAPSDQLRERVGDENFLLQVGRVSPEKNTLRVIEALWDLPQTLVFVGSPVSHSMEYARACYAKGRERGKVVFIDHIPHDELVGMYALAQVHVLPSWRETPGLASLEAGACGCTVVTTTLGSTREYFGDLADYCKPWDIQSIQQAVLKSLKRPRSNELRNLVLEKYTWETAARATLHAYEKCLNPAHLSLS